MQSRIGKNRFNGCLKGSGETAQTSSIGKRVALILVIVFITSCSTTTTRNLMLGEKIFDNSFKQMCLEGEGKGRFRYLSEKHMFNYESGFNKENEIWNIAFSIPLYGEELLQLGFKGAYEDRIVILGQFYDRLENSLHSRKDGAKRLRLLKGYILALGKFLKFYRGTQKKGADLAKWCHIVSKNKKNITGECNNKNKKRLFSWVVSESKFELYLLVGERYRFIIENFDGNSKFFGRMKIYLQDMKKFGPGSTPFTMDFFTKSCAAR